MNKSFLKRDPLYNPIAREKKKCKIIRTWERGPEITGAKGLADYIVYLEGADTRIVSRARRYPGFV